MHRMTKQWTGGRQWTRVAKHISSQPV